jgi:hypothetical protein
MKTGVITDAELFAGADPLIIANRVKSSRRWSFDRAWEATRLRRPELFGLAPLLENRLGGSGASGPEERPQLIHGPAVRLTCAPDRGSDHGEV